MTVSDGQPKIRFSLAGPYSNEGLSFGPKVITFHKDAIYHTSTDDFVELPAGTFIAQAFIEADVAINQTATCTLGVDGDPNALISDFDPTTQYNWGSNIGSTTNTTASQGFYLSAADTLRLAISTTGTVGEVSGFIVYYELKNMLSELTHFEL